MKKTSYRSIKKLIADMERDLLFHIILNMRHGILSQEKAQKLAQEFLVLQEKKDKKQIMKHIKQLGTQYREAYEVYRKYRDFYYEERKEKALKKVYYHLHNNEIEEALRTAKEVYFV